MSKINELKELNKQKQLMVSLRDQQTSQYYQNTTKQVFSHVNKVPYIEKEKYTDIEYKTVRESYQELEPYTEKQAKTRYITKWRTEKYYENQDKWEKVTKYKTETYQEEEVAPIRTGITHLLTFGIGTFGKALFTGDVAYYDTVTKTRRVPYEDYEKKTITVEKTKEISYQVPETYYEDVRKEKLVTKYRNVTKSEQVTKERDVTKYRNENVYKNVTEKKFDELKYNNDLNKVNYETEKLKQSLLDECKNLFDGAWKAESDEIEDRSAEAQELLQKGLQICLEVLKITQNDSEIEKYKEKFTSKIEGNKNFNLGLNLEEIANNLLQEAQNLKEKGKFSQAKEKFFESKEKYSIALKYFEQGNKHDHRFKENLDFVQNQINEVNNSLKEISSNNITLDLDINFNLEHQEDYQVDISGNHNYFEHI